MRTEKLRRQLRNCLELARFLEEVCGAGHDFEPVRSLESGRRALV